VTFGVECDRLRTTFDEKRDRLPAVPGVRGDGHTTPEWNAKWAAAKDADSAGQDPAGWASCLHCGGSPVTKTHVARGVRYGICAGCGL
jgi:hypothetical protein